MPAAALGLLLAGCASTGPPASIQEWSTLSDDADRANRVLHDEVLWRPWHLPGKRATDYRLVHKEGRWAVEARADHSASLLRKPVDIGPDQLADVSWSWWVEAPIPDADLADADRTDAPVRLAFAFDGDRSRLPPRERMLADLARALTGEEPPYATLVYTWSTQRPVGTVLNNPRSSRVRKIVMDTGAGHTRQWREHRRNLAADYRRVFGEAPGRLIGVALMTDADNTRSRARAWYGRIAFHPAALAAAPAASAATPQGPAAASAQRQKALPPTPAGGSATPAPR